MSENRIYIQVEEDKNRLPVSFVWKNKVYHVDDAIMASYHPGLGFPVTVKVKGKKHTLWLDGDKWYVEFRK